MKKIFLILGLSCSFFLTACGIGDTNTTYERYQVGSQGVIEKGRILEMMPVKIAGESGVGTLAGAGIGAAAGSMIGGNTAVNVIGGIAGAVVGGMAGSATGKALTQDTAYEFIIEKSNGQMISIVQTNELNLRPGDNVLINRINGTTKIRSRLNPTTYYRTY
ncbi:MAG: hypothetical protein IJC11_02425 [Alphaproteobacteria bacterium]|nr:hypothetical protein [Alphaproteobacteria bacterium]MBQ3117162.1 hypothetical protein [Alphaproteobacteria bacterium]MBQ6854687.1 hypothetical protein [Alphaproteobacteria bacterium]